VGAGGHSDQEVQVRVLGAVAPHHQIEAQLGGRLVGFFQQHPERVRAELVAELGAFRQRGGGEFVDQAAAALVQQVEEPLRAGLP